MPNTRKQNLCRHHSRIRSQNVLFTCDFKKEEISQHSKLLLKINCRTESLISKMLYPMASIRTVKRSQVDWTASLLLRYIWLFRVQKVYQRCTLFVFYVCNKLCGGKPKFLQPKKQIITYLHQRRDIQKTPIYALHAIAESPAVLSIVAKSIARKKGS